MTYVGVISAYVQNLNYHDNDDYSDDDDDDDDVFPPHHHMFRWTWNH